MLEWLASNEVYILPSVLAIVVLIVLFFWIRSATRERRFRVHLTVALEHIQEQQGLLQEQQKRFETLLEHQGQTLQGQFHTGLLHTQQEMMNLSKALRTTSQQGHWGELQLLTSLKLAGMERYCDFDVKKKFPTLDSKQYPDVVVSIPPDRYVIIDAKAPLGTYLEAIKSFEETGAMRHMKLYTDAVRSHIKALSQKAYWRHVNSPEFALLFLPSEAMFRAALEYAPDIIEYSLQYKIFLVSPISLLSLLKIIAYGWSVESRAQDFEQSVKHQQEVYRHLAKAHKQWGTLRTQLDEVVKSFNATMVAYAETLAPTLESMRQLDITLKNDSPAITPHSLLQRKLEPVPLVPDGLHDNQDAVQGDDVSTFDGSLL